MSAQQAAWEELPLGVQQRILMLTGSPCVRRVSKAWRDAFDSANDTLCVSHVFDQGLKAAATAAALRVVKNSASLTAVNFVGQEDCTSPPLALSDLLAAGVMSGLATRLQKLTGIQVTAACAAQQLQVLGQCTGLTHLDISGSDLQGCVAVELRAVLQAMSRLMRLYMCSCKLQSQHVVAGLASALQPLTQLQHLHLERSNLAAGLAALAPALSSMPGLQTLDVGTTSMFETGGAKAMCTLLSAVPGLTHLDVSHTRLQEEGAVLLAAVLRGMTCLQTLNISYCSIGDGGMAMLAPALAVLPHLHTLDVSCNDLGTNAVSLLQPVLARQGSPLRELDLSFNVVTVMGAHSLMSGLSTATQLRRLNLEHTWLGAEAWVVMAPALICLGPSLQSLQLGPGILDDAGSTALASALKALTGLTRLQAYDIFKSVLAMVTISPALTSMQRLQVLDVHGASMGAEGTTALAAALSCLAGSLKQLTLLGCTLHVEAGVKAANTLAPALAQATGLVELRLNGNDFGPQGAHWLVPVLHALPHLRIVDLSACKLGVQGCMAVARALKDRDGTFVDLRWNGVITGSADGDELCNMSGIRVRQ